ncbi:MAG: FAD-dependent oxidoreductase [Nitrosomonas sp.]|nr:FAD-dependent oxidoreductase [Nitrosomonas sp.]
MDKEIILRSVLIVGSGLAGYAVARELRKLSDTIQITMLSADHGGFYSKPMLSNALTTGKTPDSILSADAAQMASQLNMNIHPHTRVASIDPVGSSIMLENGEKLSFERLVLALGADPIRLPLAGDGAEAVLSVNDLDDYCRFREALEGKKRIAILGAGLIGCEFANDLAGKGHQVTVLDLSSQPLGRLLPPQAGQFMHDKLAAVKIDFKFNCSVSRIDKHAGQYRLFFGENEFIEAELILSAIGLKSRIALAEAAGIHVNRGIKVNRYLQTNFTEIYALGDCAEVEGKVLPFIMPITHAGRALSATLAGTPTLLHYPAMPVLVKTPACPTVVSPPDPAVSGKWEIEVDMDKVKALYRSETGNLLGFALLGTATAERGALTAQLPPVIS